MQFELHVRIAPDESLDGRRQHIARLGVGGGDRQPAMRLAAELLTDLAQVVHVVQHALGDLHHLAARLGDVGQALAVADEDVDAEFGLELADLFGNTRLRSEQGIGGFGDVETVAHDFVDVTQLLEIHAGLPDSNS